MKKTYAFIASLFLLGNNFAQQNQSEQVQAPVESQTWVEMMHDPNANFYEVQEAFRQYWEGRVIQKGKGHKVFKRWEEYMRPRVYPTGELWLPTQTMTNYKQWEKQLVSNGLTKSLNGNWSLIGPVGKPANSGAGRLNFIRFMPGNTNTIFVGAPDGGLWKTTDGGATWATNTDDLAVIGVSDLAIDPTNTQTMYLATGDYDGNDTYSTGVLKSTDGGQTWNTTGLSWTPNQGRNIGRILVNPSNPQIVIVFSSAGIFRSTNGGTTWSNPTGTFACSDGEFKPNDPNTVYAVGTIFKRSTDGGATWSTVSTGVTGVTRLSMAVTPANANYIYILAANNTDSGFKALIRSTDSGASFTTRMSATGSNNILGFDNGSDAGGQGWYDLSIAVSNTNAEEVFTGGINHWKSINGGTSFTLNTHWYGGFSKPYVHADVHDIQYLPSSGTTVFSANDGGIFKSTNGGSSWTDISNNLAIAQQYRMSMSTSSEYLILAGHQDNGTNRTANGTSWTNVGGGDGMDCMIDRTNNNLQIASVYYGDYSRTTTGGVNFSDINDPAVQGEWVSPIHQDPVTASVVYAGGRSALYKTSNIAAGSVSWSAMGTPSGSGSIIEFAIAPSNNQVIYTVKDGNSGVAKSTNGGTSFTACATPTTAVSPTWVAISNTDPNVVYVTYSGYSSNSKIYKSTNGGTNWTNLSSGLPNVPVNCVVYQNNSNDAIYIGTDVGVYYRDNSMTSWVEFSVGMPNVAVTDLEIYYPTSKIRAATFGRGTWESDLYSQATTPVAAFSASATSICAGSTVTFSNNTSGGATNYEWSFPGGNPSTSTAVNPTVMYTNPGTYDVQLIASNSMGADTIVLQAYVTASSGTAIPFTEGFDNAAFPYVGWDVVDLQGNNTWARTTAAGVNPTPASSIFFNNYSIDDRGSNDYVDLPSLDLSGSVSASMSFDVAYAPYDAANYDSLQVLVSTDCGMTFTSVYKKGNTQLATAASTTANFVPSAAQWRNETVDLSAFALNSNVLIRVKNIAGYGNNTYVDNINVIGTPGTPPTASFTQNNNVICSGSSVTYTNTSLDNPTTYAWTFEGGTPATSSIANPTVTYATSGVYDVQLIVSNNFGSDTLSLTNLVQVNQSPATPTIAASGATTFCTGGSVTLTSSLAAGNTWSTTETTQAITVNASGTYTVSTTNGSCTATSAPTVVTVNAIPATPVITANGPTTFCQGGNVIITSSSASGNTWSTNATSNQIIVTASTSNITTTVTTNGCTSAVSNAISVVVNPLPTVNLGNFAAICDTANILVLAGGTPAGGTYTGTGVSANNFNPATAGVGTHTITYTFTNANNCTASDQSTIVVNNCSGASINEALINGIVLYPNPADLILNVDGERLNEINTIQLLDNSGKLVKTWKVDGTPMKLDVSPFAAGNYTLKLIGSQVELIQKVQLK